MSDPGNKIYVGRLNDGSILLCLTDPAIKDIVAAPAVTLTGDGIEITVLYGETEVDVIQKLRTLAFRGKLLPKTEA